MLCIVFFFIILSSTKEARRKSNVEKCYHFNAFLAMIQISTEIDKISLCREKLV